MASLTRQSCLTPGLSAVLINGRSCALAPGRRPGNVNRNRDGLTCPASSSTDCWQSTSRSGHDVDLKFTSVPPHFRKSGARPARIWLHRVVCAQRAAPIFASLRRRFNRRACQVVKLLDHVVRHVDRCVARIRRTIARGTAWLRVLFKNHDEPRVSVGDRTVGGSLARGSAASTPLSTVR